MRATVNGAADWAGKPATAAAVLLFLVVLLLLAFGDGLAYMVQIWHREEYSHGWLIPFIALFMAWRRRRDVLAAEWHSEWAGVALVGFAMIALVLGELSTLYTIIQYGFLLALAGFVLAAVGWGALRALAVPLIYLVFMIPFPNFLYNTLSQKLQLLSSAIGVAFMRLFDVSVFLEGNVIDLGVYQLQVVEACNGLRYLFPLMSFGFLCAYLFRAPLWQRALVFLSSVPLTVLMNSFRVGVIGILVNSYGIQQAEGFLHYFEGWVIFMSCVALMFAEMWLLTRLTQRERSFRDTFNLDFGEEPETGWRWPRVEPPLVLAVVAVVVTAIGLRFVEHRDEIVPERTRFSTFPLVVDDWRGVEEPLEPRIVEALDVDDYIMANYVHLADKMPVNFYVAYYSSQRKGASIHSPRSCLPGHDWEMEQLSVRKVEGLGMPLRVNRVVISKSGQRQLVYYWFEQRGRKLTSEYAVKAYLLLDAIKLNRTDGALVRVTTPVMRGTDIAEAEQRLQDLLRELYPRLSPYIPN